MDIPWKGIIRRQFGAAIDVLEDANHPCPFPWMEPGFVELQLYSMRHAQEHAARLSRFLGQNGVAPPDWVAAARESRPARPAAGNRPC